MRRATFEYIVGELREDLVRETTHMRDPVPPEEMIAIIIWKLATGTTNSATLPAFGRGVSTVCGIFDEVCELIAAKLTEKWICIDYLEDIISGFEERGFPNAWGAVDGTHIEIRSPPFSGDKYINRKGYCSMILQAVVDSDARFLDIFVGFPGRAHDARVLRNSPLFKRLEDGARRPKRPVTLEGVTFDPVIIGDPAYPLRPWLMKPYPAPSTRAQERFNYRLSRARMSVERSFGILKNRWLYLQRPLLVSERLMVAVITTCCILHNICLSRGDIVYGPFPREPLMEPGDERPQIPWSEAALTARAVSIRAAISTHFQQYR
ncbi:uncharacterized protein LOC129323443 [Eublepharis macularius]|uniref:Uncharacterized protein LOC129323443 n=1 Tax=Eublepharis macularius TaxID=481883 RepID=A0AA97IUR0_EUBMA|nr:uncharacterized protein LOC129323443 [Eublepharis macularius]